MSAVRGHHVEAAVAEMVAVLAPAAHLDWGVPAGSLEWTCWTTAAHVAHDLGAYAGQVAGRATTGYLPFELRVAPDATPLDVLSVVSACGRLLRLAVDGAGAGAVAWHWGAADAAGFAAMGVAEVLVHTADITRGLGVAWLPPASLCQLVIDRLLGGPAPPGGAADVLLWATGRGELPGRSPVDDWVWRAAPS